MMSYTGRLRPKGALFRLQAPVVQKLDSAIHWINQYPTDKCYGNHCAIQWIVIYPLDSVIHLLNNWGQAYERVGIF